MCLQAWINPVYSLPETLIIKTSFGKNISDTIPGGETISYRFEYQLNSSTDKENFLNVYTGVSKLNVPLTRVHSILQGT